MQSHVTQSLTHLKLFSIFGTEQLKQHLALQDAILCDLSVGINQHVYLLFKLPNAQSKLVSAADMYRWLCTPTFYTVVDITPDWSNHNLKEVSFWPLGCLNFTFNFVLPIGNDFLLIGSRSVHQDGAAQNNAWVVSRTGQVRNQFCFGDGILNCVLTKDGSIVTGYFDEGVYGNLGWKQPLGASGLNVWSAQGDLLWSNQKYPIDALRALNLDNQGHLWFYYHNECQVVRCDLRCQNQDRLVAQNNDLIFEAPDEGIVAFAVGTSGQYFLLQGEGDCQGKLFLSQLQDGQLGIVNQVTPLFKGQKVTMQRCHMQGNMVLIQTDKGEILGAQIP